MNKQNLKDVSSPSKIRRRLKQPGSINQPPMINSRYDMDVWTYEQLKRIEAQNEELIRQAREKCWQDNFVRNKLQKTWEDDIKERNEEEEIYLMKEFSKIIMDNIDVFKRLAEK